MKSTPTKVRLRTCCSLKLAMSNIDPEFQPILDCSVIASCKNEDKERGK